MPAHYLVGLLNYPNSYVPSALQGHTSGTEKAGGGSQTCSESGYSSAWCDEEFGPWNYVPSVGFSDIEPYYDPTTGEKVTGEFICTTDNGFGNSANSWDYPLHLHRMKIQKPFTFRHGESTFETYTETESQGVILLHDPNNMIRWENGADIQVAYATPDSTWDDWKTLRVLTGRDFDLEGLAVKNGTYAVAGEELMPALFAVNPSTGVVLSNFVRTPDIDAAGNFNGKFLSSKGDKVHCSIEALEANSCKMVTDADVDASDYVRHGSSGGYEGLVMMADGSVTAFIERNAGSTLADRGEPGIRVYRVQADPLMFESFYGFYQFDDGAEAIADAAPLPGSSTKIAVIERAGWPSGKLVPGQGLPNNRVCIIDLTVKDANHVFRKSCVLNYHAVSDPFDVDGNSLTTAAFSQWTSEQLIVLDDWCMMAGTDTNFPATNQFGLTSAEAPHFQQVADTRWMVVCFYDAIFKAENAVISTPTSMMPAHYLVGLLNYPNSYVPSALQGHTSGTEKAGGGSQTCSESGYSSAWCDEEFGPWNYVPSVGFSDIEPYYDPTTGEKVTGEFICTTDNGFGNSANSWDYPLHLHRMKIQKPFTFRHGESTFETYTETESQGVILLHDPNNMIRWENGADIQVAYATPDSTWDDWKTLRVLTGRDFDLEGLAVKNGTYAVAGEELMPALFAVNPSTGVVLSNFVRTPDIDAAGNFNGKFLSSKGDKVHCSIEALEANSCKMVTDADVDASDYVRHGSSGGYEGLVMMADGSVTAFIERNAGSTLADRGEPGIRVYRVQADPLMFESFYGFYQFDDGAEAIADAAPLPGSSTKIAVIERAGWPSGKLVPGQGLPNNRVCIIDLTVKDANHVFRKSCVLNYHAVSDPFDVDGNSLTTAAFSQWTSEQLIVLDDWCMMAGTDTNFPATNQFGLTSAEAPHFQQVADTRWMVVCFYDAVFSESYHDTHLTPRSTTCGDLKAYYNDQSCCGTPSKVIPAPTFP